MNPIKTIITVITAGFLFLSFSGCALIESEAGKYIVEVEYNGISARVVNAQDAEATKITYRTADGTELTFEKQGQSATNPINAAAETNKIQAEIGRAILEKVPAL